METGHQTMRILESQQKNHFFRSPISKNAKNVLDIGTGQGNWAIDVARQFSHLTVRGVELFPPPHTWAPSSCLFEVDDVPQEWTYREPFDLIQIKQLLVALTPNQTDDLHKRGYDNLAPGGWIEQLEVFVDTQSLNSTTPTNSIMAGLYEMFMEICNNAGTPINIESTMLGRIKAACTSVSIRGRSCRGMQGVQRSRSCVGVPKADTDSDERRPCQPLFVAVGEVGVVCAALDGG